MNAPSPLRLETILVPTDFSEPSANALRCAEQLARETGARIVLLHSFDASAYSAALAPSLALTGLVASYHAHARGVAEGQLTDLAQASRERGFRTEARFCDGAAAEQITDSGHACAADLMVLSTHGRTGWRRFLLGSVAEKVLRVAPCPVLCLHGRLDPQIPPAEAGATGLTAAPLQLRQILVTTDFSPAAETAFPWAERLARAAGAKLTLLHVLEPGKVLEPTPSEAAPEPAGREFELVHGGIREALLQSLAQTCGRWESAGCAAEPLLIHGQPPECICQSAHDTQADLIVLASQGTTEWQRAFLGSTAERVVRGAGCPVLVVPARQLAR